MALKKTAIIELLVKDKGSLASTKNLKQEFQQLNASVENFGNEAQGALARFNPQKRITQVNALSSSFKKSQGSIKGSTNAVTNLSRIIQDAPFGTIGVANNIDPFIQSFQRMGDASTSTSQKIKGLITSAFTGSGALITISALVTSAMTAIQMGLFDMGSEAESSEKKMQGLLDAAKELRGIAESGLGLAATLEEDMERNREALRIAEQRAALEERIAIKGISVGSGRTTSQQRELQWLKEQKQAYDDLITSLGFENTEMEALQKNLESLQQQHEIYTGELGNSEMKVKAFADAVSSDAQQAINRYNAGVDTSTVRLQTQRNRIQNLITSWQQLARNGNEDLIPVINFLKDTLGDLNSELDEAQKKSEQTGGSFSGSGFMESARQAQQADTSVPAQQPEDQVIRDDDIFEPIPQTAIDQEMQKQQQLIDGWQKIGDKADEAGDKQQQAAKMSAKQIGTASAAAINHADTVQEAGKNIVKTLINEIITRAILAAFNPPTPASLALAPVLAATAQKIIGSFVGFRSGVDDFEGGMARVHKDEIVTNLPEGSNVITNQNVQRLDRMQRQAGQGAGNLMGNNSAIQQKAIKEGVIEGMRQTGITVNISADRIDEEIQKHKEHQNRIGNNR